MALMINLALLDPDPRNVRDRTPADDHDIAELADDIRVNGMHNPLTVYENPAAPGRFKVWFGHRRLLALEQLGWLEAECTVRPAPVSGVERIVRQVAENEKRKNLNPLELARAYRDTLAEDPELNQAALAKMYGVAQSKISNHLMLLEMTPQLQAKVAAGELGVTKAVRLWNTQAKAPTGTARADHGKAHTQSARNDDACLNSSNRYYAAAYHLCHNVLSHTDATRIGGACGDCWMEAAVKTEVHRGAHPETDLATFNTPLDALRTMKCRRCKIPAGEYRNKRCQQPREGKLVLYDNHVFSLIAHTDVAAGAAETAPVPM